MEKSKPEVKKDFKTSGKGTTDNNKKKNNNNNDLNQEKLIQEKAQSFLKLARLAVKSLDYQKAITNYLKVHFLLPTQI